VGTERTAALLRDALDGDPPVRFASSAEVYRRPPQTALAFRELLQREVAAGTRRVRVIGETVFGEHPATWSKWTHYEAVINHALAPYPAWGVCIFDTRRLPGEVLAAAELTHPYVRTATSRAANPRYVEPAEVLHRLPDAGPDPLEATQPALEVADLTDLWRLHQQLHDALAGAALTAETKGEFVFAVTEVATNALRHGRPPVRVRAWVTPGRLLCTVIDHGAGIDDPFAGYLPAHSNPARGGQGLWLARSLCDHITFHRTAEGFTVRLATGG
jgi:anti-sigma regulatory factor (Ser/Thr protein kinase)